MKLKKIPWSRLNNLFIRGLFSIAAFASVLILVPVMAHAQTSVTVAWDASNPVPDGYILYWGTSSGNYPDSHDVGNATQYTIPGLQDGLTYYFAVKAYDDGNQSAFSQEISHTVATPNSSPNTPSVPNGPANGFIQTDYGFSSTASDPDNDTLQYRFDWGDGVISGWGNSTQSHSWSSTGNYCVKARAMDGNGATSGWSNCGSVNIGLNTHTIAASAGSHGSITPAGSVVVNNAASRTFTINPEQDYQVLEVRVDGTLIGTATSYTFNNVTGDHTITASYVYVDPDPDSDGDGVPDAQDAFPQESNETTDTDGDGTGNNADEDDDGDGMPDAWEIVNNLDPLDADDATGDPDDDGISNLEELNTYNTNPHNADTDGDGFLDGEEVASGSDPVDQNSKPTIDAAWNSAASFSAIFELGTGNTGVVEVNFDVTPHINYLDGVIGYADSSVEITAYRDMAMTVRMNSIGRFDVRNGGGYDAEMDVIYTANSTYHVRMISDLDAGTYDVWVTPQGGTEIQIAKGYIFRSDAALTDDLGKVCLIDSIGEFRVENHTVIAVTIPGDPNTSDDDYDGYTEVQGDCNDEDVAVYPGASEICGDGVDQDCNGSDLTCIGLNTHTIAASAGSHGSITPAGSVVVNSAASRTFTINPEQDYQVLEVRVDGTLIGTTTSYTFNNVTEDHTITASFVYVDPDPDSDGDGVPDAQDAFPQDSTETTDTDGDGTGNYADEDDDGDGMPDAWEIVNNLDPLDANDATGDPDDDGISNLEEYTDGTGPHTYEDPSVPDAPVILDLDNEVVSLTPVLTAGEFYDPDNDETHAASRWMIFRAADNFCVFDVTSPASLTDLRVPNLILEEDTEYIWKVQFINNRDAESDWSEVGAFTSDFADHDQNGDGIPDSQEVAVDLDLDNDGVMDSEQADIKCVSSETDDVQIGISVKDSENVASIVSMEIEDADQTVANDESVERPESIQFGLIDFKILVDTPGDETVVTIHLSSPVMEDGLLLKYDPINAQWLDYSDYAEFSPDRQVVYLTLQDGGFGDADGIENGIIVDPLTIGTAIGGGGGSGGSSAAGEIVESLIPWNNACFISTAAQQGNNGGWSLWSEIRDRELVVLFALIVLAYVGWLVFGRKKIYHGDARNFTDNIKDWILF